MVGLLSSSNHPFSFFLVDGDGAARAAGCQNRCLGG
jgi:hypothetical protein